MFSPEIFCIIWPRLTCFRHRYSAPWAWPQKYDTTALHVDQSMLQLQYIYLSISLWPLPTLRIFHDKLCSFCPNCMRIIRGQCRKIVIHWIRTRCSFPDSWRFDTDPHPRIRTTGLRIRIRILPFSSVTFKMPTKSNFFPPKFFVCLLLTVGTFISVLFQR